MDATIIKYNKYLYGAAKILRRPVTVMMVGHNLSQTKNTIVLAKSLYIKKPESYGKIRVIPGYEALTDIDCKCLPEVVEVKYKDTMFIGKDVSLAQIRNFRLPVIKSYYFNVAELDAYHLFAQMYIPVSNKFSSLVAVPKSNIVSLEKR